MNTQNTNSASTSSPQVTVGNIGSRKTAGPDSSGGVEDVEFSAEFNLALLQLTTQSFSEEQLRKQLRLLSIKFTGAVGAGTRHL